MSVLSKTVNFQFFFQLVPFCFSVFIEFLVWKCGKKDCIIVVIRLSHLITCRRMMASTFTSLSTVTCILWKVWNSSAVHVRWSLLLLIYQSYQSGWRCSVVVTRIGFDQQS